MIFVILWGAVFFAGETLSQQNGFRPPDGKTWLFIGQNKESIDAYVRAFGVVPAGVMLYTSIQDLNGLDKPSDLGAGVHHGNYLLKKYPQSALQIGLYMVGALEGMNRGAYDTNISRLARWVRDAGRPVFLRIGYEFDFPDNQYDPVQYQKAFRRIVEMFRSLDVENAVFVWHSALPSGRKTDVMAWYPGDEYVDWFAVSFFALNQFRPAEEFASLARRHGKAFMIAEATPSGTTIVRSKIDWLKKFFRLIESTGAEAACYINTDWESQPMFRGQGWGDSRLQVHPELKEFWLSETRKERFLSGLSDEVKAQNQIQDLNHR